MPETIVLTNLRSKSINVEPTSSRNFSTTPVSHSNASRLADLSKCFEPEVVIHGNISPGASMVRNLTRSNLGTGRSGGLTKRSVSHSARVLRLRERRAGNADMYAWSNDFGNLHPRISSRFTVVNLLSVSNNSGGE